jgi:hypothetical protein
MIQGAPRGVNGSVSEAVVKFGQVRRSEEPRQPVSKHRHVPARRDSAFLSPCSSSVVLASSSHPGCLAQAGWVGLGLGKMVGEEGVGG